MVLGGEGQRAVAEKLGVTRQAVNLWVHAYRREDWATLGRARPGRPARPPLTPRQESELAAAISGNPPTRLGLPFRVWTREAIRRLAQERCGVCLSRRGLESCLGRWGFRPLRAVRRAFEGREPRGPAV
jgi:transposase